MEDRQRGPGPGSEGASGAPDDSAVTPERRSHNRTLLRRYVTEVLGAGDLDTVDEIFHEDVEMVTRDGRAITGREAVKEYLGSVRERFADLETEVITVMATADEAMAKFEVTAVHEGDYFGVDPSNREVTFSVFSHALVEEGTMISQGDLVNPLRMQPPSKRHSRSEVLEQIRDGVVVVDREGRVVDVNPVARGLLGVEDRDVLNDPVESLLGGDVDLPGTGSSAEVALDDGRRIVDVAVSSLTDLQDDRIGRILVLRDVTERVRRRQQLEVLSRRNDHLDRFVSTVSHDLRNPLNTASGYLELARESGDGEHFDRVADSHERMESIVDELLTRARSGTTVEETETVGLANCIETAWGTASTEGGDLECRVPDEYTVEADPDLLEHVLENLFRNAADHNDPAPTVTVGTLTASEGFYVSDDGRGIPPGDRDDVFDHGYTTAEDGTGLGLSIVSEFIQAHGWAVDVAESENGGARFEIRTDPVRESA